MIINLATLYRKLYLLLEIDKHSRLRVYQYNIILPSSSDFFSESSSTEPLRRACALIYIYIENPLPFELLVPQEKCFRLEMYRKVLLNFYNRADFVCMSVQVAQWPVADFYICLSVNSSEAVLTPH